MFSTFFFDLDLVEVDEEEEEEEEDEEEEEEEDEEEDEEEEEEDDDFLVGDVCFVTFRAVLPFIFTHLPVLGFLSFPSGQGCALVVPFVAATLHLFVRGLRSFPTGHGCMVG